VVYVRDDMSTAVILLELARSVMVLLSRSRLKCCEMFQKISVNRKKTCPSLGLPTYLVSMRANLAIIKHTCQKCYFVNRDGLLQVGRAPPLPAVSARAVSGDRLVWCVLSWRAAFAFLFFSVASPLLSARCARAGRSAPCARCSGTVPAAPRAARCASGSSSCCTAHWASPHDCHWFPQRKNFCISCMYVYVYTLTLCTL